MKKTIDTNVNLVADQEAHENFKQFLGEANSYLAGTKDQETIDKMIVLAYKLTGYAYWGTRSEQLYDNGFPEMVLLVNFLGKYFPKKNNN